MMTSSNRTQLLIGAVALISGAIALVVLAGLPDRAARSGNSVAPEIGALAPLFASTTITGERIDLADLHGKPVIINFWATWCQPCLVEMPELEMLYQQHHQGGLHILAINLGEAPEVIEEWDRAMGLSFDLVLDEDGHIAALYRLRGQPSTYLITPEGTIDDIFYGPTTQDPLRAALAPYLS